MAVKIGDVVTFIDTHRVEHQAIVTQLHDAGMPEVYPTPAINLLYVSKDDTRTDGYGRQIERASSVPHEGSNTAKAYCWK